MIGILAGLATANLGEWLIHKYVLHGLGKRKKSFWSFHWHEHHAESRRHDMHDKFYDRSVFGWNPQGKEALSLLGMGIAVTPLFPIAPLFTATLWYSGWNYHRVHKRAHLDPPWAREHLPWHVDHHMGPRQDANWCVSHPWSDLLLGTRIPWVGTEAERAPRSRVRTSMVDKAHPATESGSMSSSSSEGRPR